MYRRFKTSLYCLTLLPAIALPADPGTLAQFRCLASGHWDNVAQAEADIAAGQCITSSFTEEPILVEGHGELWPDKLVRHDQNFTLQGAAIAIPGGASPEVFDKLAVPPEQPPGLSAQIAAISVRPDCPR